MLKNYYQVLGLKDSSASPEQIKSAYRKLSKQYHPDLNPGNPNATTMFKEINEAYTELEDTKKRAAYDLEYKQVFGQVNGKEHIRNFNDEFAQKTKENVSAIITPIRNSNKQNQPISDSDFHENNFYAVLGLRFGDNYSKEQINSACQEMKSRASKEHGFMTPEYMEEIRKYNNARSVLTDPSSRQELDQYLTRYLRQREEELDRRQQEEQREKTQYEREQKKPQSAQSNTKKPFAETLKDTSERIIKWLIRTKENIAALSRMTAIARADPILCLGKDIVQFDKAEKKFDAMSNAWDNYWQHLGNDGKDGELKQEQRANMAVANGKLLEKWEDINLRLESLLGGKHQLSEFSPKVLKIVERIAAAREEIYINRHKEYIRKKAATAGRLTARDKEDLEREKESLDEETRIINNLAEQLRLANSKYKKQKR